MPSMYGFVNTDSWIDSARPKSYREGLLRWYPNGRTPLTALSSQMTKSSAITDPEHHWFIKDFPLQRAAFTTPAADPLGLFTDMALTAAYAGGAVVGTTLHLGIASTFCAEVRPGHTLRLSDASHPNNTGVLLVTDVVQSVVGTTGRISMQALEIDDNGAGYAPAVTWVTTHNALIIGNLNSEFDTRPDAVQYDADIFDTNAAIWRTPLNISRTAEKTKIRYASDAYKMLKMGTLELHGWEIEKAAFMGVDWTSRANGNPIRSAVGLIPWIFANINRATGPSHIFDFVNDATVPAGTTWVTGGKQWLNRSLAVIFGSGDPDRMAFCGIGAGEGVNQLAEVHGNIQLSSDSKLFGLDLTTWQMSGAKMGFKSHPLFNSSVTDPLYNAFCIFNPRHTGFRYIDDTKFLSSPSSGRNTVGEAGIDGRLEEYLTEGCFEWGMPVECAMLYNVGVDKP